MTENEHQYGVRRVNGTLWLAVTALAIGCLAYFLQNNTADPRDELAKSLTVYCAAGVRLAVEEAAKQFEREMDVSVKLEYANSGVLANRLKIDKEGGLASADVYIPAITPTRKKPPPMASHGNRYVWPRGRLCSA